MPQGFAIELLSLLLNTRSLIMPLFSPELKKKKKKNSRYIDEKQIHLHGS